MNVDALRLFRDIVLHRSLSRAATEHHLTPSAVSQHVQELERGYGTTLLDRSTRPLTVTPAGRLYDQFCKETLRLHDGLQASLAESAGGGTGPLRVAAIYSVGLLEMWAVEEEFGRRLPGVVLHVEYLRPERVYEAVREERAELGIVSYPSASRDMAVVPWRDEEMVVAVAPGHPLARRRRVAPADLDGLDFVAFDEDLPIRREVDRYLREGGAAVRVVMHFDNLQMIKEAVALDSGASIVPARVVQAEVEQGRIVTVPLVPPLQRPIGVIYRKRRRLSAAALAFLELLQAMPEAELQTR